MREVLLQISYECINQNPRDLAQVIDGTPGDWAGMQILTLLCEPLKNVSSPETQSGPQRYIFIIIANTS